MVDTVKKDEWLQRVLGVSLKVHTPEPHITKLRFDPVPKEIPRPSGKGVKISTTSKGDQPITVTEPQVRHFKGQDQGKDRKIHVTKTPDGRVVYTAPSPPVGEITFSGGGGKGAALPGAVKALHDSGVLKGARKISGASVGSMTAALVAAGITGDEFAEIANSQETTDRIVEGTGGTKLGLLWQAMKNEWNTGHASPLTGKGLEDVVCDALNLTLDKRIKETLEEYNSRQELAPEELFEILPRLEKKPGPTFMDLRVLSKFIPSVKEAVITGTYTEELDEYNYRTDDGNRRGLLYVFSADNEPNLPVAVAVHASASFPAAFKPVDITLSSGMTVRFIDGGVMNNTPTASSLGTERELDGMPQERGMAFVFEDEPPKNLLGKKTGNSVSENLLLGTVNPSVGKGARLVDWFVGSDHVGSEYAKDRDLTDRPEDIVVVPLKITRPKTSKPGKKKKIDMRGGTLEFNLSDKDKLALQQQTEQATLEQINRENNRDRSREFASDSQMFVSIPMKDLELLASNGYDGAAAARDFRRNVADRVNELKLALNQAHSEGLAAFLLDRPEVQQCLDILNQLAGDDVDFQGYVGRELNRGELDTLVDLMRQHKQGGPVGEASTAVSDTLAIRNKAHHVLTQVIYRQMKKQGSPTGAGMQTIQVMEALLREAKTKDDVNEALEIGIAHFSTKSDKSIPKRGHKQFAKDLTHQLMH